MPIEVQCRSLGAPSFDGRKARHFLWANLVLLKPERPALLLQAPGGAHAQGTSGDSALATVAIPRSPGRACAQTISERAKVSALAWCFHERQTRIIDQSGHGLKAMGPSAQGLRALGSVVGAGAAALAGTATPYPAEGYGLHHRGWMPSIRANARPGFGCHHAEPVEPASSLLSAAVARAAQYPFPTCPWEWLRPLRSAGRAGSPHSTL